MPAKRVLIQVTSALGATECILVRNFVREESLGLCLNFQLDKL